MKVLRVAIIAVICFALYLGLRPSYMQSHSPEFARIKRLNKIGNAIQHYSYEHGNQLPKKLSDMVPGYISLENIGLFYPSEFTNSSTQGLPSGWESNPELVDTFSDCIYLGAAGVSHEVIAYEREGDWNQATNVHLHIIPPGGGLTSVTKQELNELLHSPESPILEHLRRQHVSYYEANLHASLNSYRSDYGVYPLGDNAKVTRILRGENPAKRQYHSTYMQERNENGEDLDPWGTPYLINSDGNIVKMKSAGVNRKFDEVKASDYDDVCNSVVSGATSGDDTKF